MLVVTGAAGFIGSCLVSKLNDLGFKDLVLVDDFSKEEKRANWTGKKFTKTIDRSEFFQLRILIRLITYHFYLNLSPLSLNVFEVLL